MNLTQKADYAIRTILYLSECGKGFKVNAKTISEKQNIPFRFLLQLLQKLRDSGIVVSFMGVNGGYALAHEPHELSLLEVIESIEGPLYLNRCMFDDEHCNHTGAKNCAVHRALKKTQQNLRADLERTNFQDLLEDSE